MLPKKQTKQKTIL